MISKCFILYQQAVNFVIKNSDKLRYKFLKLYWKGCLNLIWAGIKKRFRPSAVGTLSFVWKSPFCYSCFILVDKASPHDFLAYKSTVLNLVRSPVGISRVRPEHRSHLKHWLCLNCGRTGSRPWENIRDPRCRHVLSYLRTEPGRGPTYAAARGGSMFCTLIWQVYRD